MNSRLVSIVLLLLLAATSNPREIQEHLLQIYKQIELEISEKFNHCFQLTFVAEVKAAKDSMGHDWSSYVHNGNNNNNNGKNKNLKYGANLILSFTEPFSNASWSTERDLARYPIRFHYACSVVLYNIDSFLNLEESELDPLGNYLVWQDEILRKVPNSLSAIVIYLTFQKEGISEKLLRFSKISAIIRYPLFLVIDPEEKDAVVIRIYRSSPGLEKTLYEVGAYNSKGESGLQLHDELLSSKLENFEARSLDIVACPVCMEAAENFKVEGVWEDMLMAVATEVMRLFNVSIETSSALGIPSGGQNEEGEWDDFTKPLLDGSSAVSLVIKPTFGKAQVLHLTKEYMFDSAVFITGPPTKSRFGSLRVLKDPLEAVVWLGFLVSVCFMVLSLSLVLLVKRRSSFAPRVVLSAVLNPILDQLAFANYSRASSISKDRVVNLLFGSYLLGLIVLGCAYKSNLISAIVSPHFLPRPQNFHELAASKYEIGIVFFTGFLENDLKALRTPVNVEILRRAQEYDYLAEECYQRIFEGNSACMGFTMAFDAIGIEFMVDINGQKMYTQSKDSHFQGLMNAGVSKFYPMFLDPMNYYFSLSDSVGLTNFYKAYFQKKVLKKGKSYALKNVDKKKYYAGNANYDEDEEESRQFSALLKRIIFYGTGTGLMALVLEHIVRITIKVYSRNRVIPLLQDEGILLFPSSKEFETSCSSNFIAELLPLKRLRRFVLD